MKKILLAAALFVSALAFEKPANAQVSLNINIGSQPEWGPVGYDRADYYYMPDIDTYYSVPTHEFVYLNGNRWVRTNNLPSRYSNYNLYNSYKVVINDRNPWERNDVYRTRYAKYRGNHNQVIIRDSRDAKYKNYWKGNNGNHNGWKKDKGRGNGHGNGRGNGHGHGKGH
ncbi:hypothetical protein KHS38_15515 [Mucilaginibacter sp. Bleaf8]|uniref:hypothetical protein n=1 Tax=Mucilaginibacter sp. Bleaf8 TaxID=2834430 RepID=UPI001BCA785A|nr:hypothetical protein [Mucilaginibacter sp. Bleaf8]MBS7565815.1 hypothetical protein [Mucilaginibacter sp. Bleaf8]